MRSRHNAESSCEISDVHGRASWHPSGSSAMPTAAAAAFKVSLQIWYMTVLERQYPDILCHNTQPFLGSHCQLGLQRGILSDHIPSWGCPQHCPSPWSPSRKGRILVRQGSLEAHHCWKGWWKLEFVYCSCPKMQTTWCPWCFAEFVVHPVKPDSFFHKRSIPYWGLDLMQCQTGQHIQEAAQWRIRRHQSSQHHTT